MKSFIQMIFIVLTFALTISAQVNTSINNEYESVAEEESLTDEEQIQVIVFKKVIKSWFSSGRKTLTVYYLAFDDRDPSEKVLKRLTDFNQHVKPTSQAIVSVSDSIIQDKETGERGVLLSIWKIEWKSKNEVKLSAVNGIGNMGANGCDYTLRKENEKWEIISEEKCWVS